MRVGCLGFPTSQFCLTDDPVLIEAGLGLDVLEQVKELGGEDRNIVVETVGADVCPFGPCVEGGSGLATARPPQHDVPMCVNRLCCWCAGIEADLLPGLAGDDLAWLEDVDCNAQGTGEEACNF